MKILNIMILLFVIPTQIFAANINKLDGRYENAYSCFISKEKCSCEKNIVPKEMAQYILHEFKAFEESLTSKGVDFNKLPESLEPDSTVVMAMKEGMCIFFELMPCISNVLDSNDAGAIQQLKSGLHESEIYMLMFKTIYG